MRPAALLAQRSTGHLANLLSFKGVQLGLGAKRNIIRHDGNTLALTPKEFEFLAFLAQNLGLVFTREKLLEKVWGYDYGGDTRTMDVHVRWLRQIFLPSLPMECKILLTFY